MKKILIYCCLFLAPISSYAATIYWVDDNGEAAHTECFGASPLSGASACPITEMSDINGAAAAGDTVYFRTGSYETTANVVVPGVSGESGLRITYSSYNSEVVTITYTGSQASAIYAVLLNGKDYITINGINFVSFPRNVLIYNGADYNIISYCDIYHTAAVAGGTGRGIQIRGNTTASTHNWIHHNTVHGLYNSPCGEGGDGIMIGDTGAGDGDDDSNYNTVEYNLIYNIGHAATENFSHYNVFRNNRVYNPGFKTFTANLTGTATGGSTTTLIDTSKNFSALGADAGTFLYVHDLSDPGSGSAKRAEITGITTTTNSNDTLTFSAGTSAPTFAEGHSYSIGCLYFADSSAPGDGKYAHRAFHSDSHSGQRTEAHRDMILWEGNRGGHAASNPGNDGADGLSLSSGYSIVRYNAFYGNAGPGLYFKNSIVSSYNHVYNNTIYGNGKFSGTQFPFNPITTTDIQLTATTTYNCLKNNIIYGGAGGAFDGAIPATWTVSNNWCPDAIAGCVEATRAADPLFTDTTLTSYSSATLPNLSLQSGSRAIDGGTHLTTVHADDTGSGTTLKVADALYFQDGTWGSSLAGHTADWIAVGTVSNVVQISSIDYTTNTITLANGISRSDGDPVWLYKKSDGEIVLSGSAPDYGAYEYVSDAATIQQGVHVGGGGDGGGVWSTMQ